MRDFDRNLKKSTELGESGTKPRRRSLTVSELVAVSEEEHFKSETYRQSTTASSLLVTSTVIVDDELNLSKKNMVSYLFLTLREKVFI